jgi:hypothetical protein
MPWKGERVGCLVVGDGGFLVVESEVAALAAPVVDGVLVGDRDVEAEQPAGEADGADGVEFEDVCVVVGVEAGVFEEAAEEASGFDGVADVVVEEVEPRFRPLELAGGVTVVGVGACGADPEVEVAVVCLDG